MNLNWNNLIMWHVYNWNITKNKLLNVVNIFSRVNFYNTHSTERLRELYTCYTFEYKSVYNRWCLHCSGIGSLVKQHSCKFLMSIHFFIFLEIDLKIGVHIAIELPCAKLLWFYCYISIDKHSVIVRRSFGWNGIRTIRQTTSCR